MKKDAWLLLLFNLCTSTWRTLSRSCLTNPSHFLVTLLYDPYLPSGVSSNSYLIFNSFAMASIKSIENPSYLSFPMWVSLSSFSFKYGAPCNERCLETYLGVIKSVRYDEIYEINMEIIYNITYYVINKFLTNREETIKVLLWNLSDNLWASIVSKAFE